LEEVRPFVAQGQIEPEVERILDAQAGERAIGVGQHRAHGRVWDGRLVEAAAGADRQRGAGLDIDAEPVGEGVLPVVHHRGRELAAGVVREHGLQLVVHRPQREVHVVLGVEPGQEVVADACADHVRGGHGELHALVPEERTIRQAVGQREVGVALEVDRDPASVGDAEVEALDRAELDAHAAAEADALTRELGRDALRVPGVVDHVEAS
jgi:hypothetical protein